MTTIRELAPVVGFMQSTVHDFLTQHGHLDGGDRYTRSIRRPLSREAVEAVMRAPRAELAAIEGFSWNTAPDLITTAQAAQLARTSPATIRQWAARAKLSPAGRAGRSVTYRRDDVKRVASETLDARSEWRHGIYISTSKIPRDAMLTVADVAKLAAKSESTVRSWIARGILPTAGRQGRRTLISAYDAAGFRAHNQYEPYDAPPSQRQ